MAGLASQWARAWDEVDSSSACGTAPWHPLAVMAQLSRWPLAGLIT